ncbi:SDR family NAD(P)-dependent oxidoreductase [Alteromonas sp. M12]|uniref:SDR family NAD(P)-dependent oxidoreductase n=1 Tax=Alteromonas sp. M12 TaxID=3135644 RepID=UPI00319EB46E
MATKTLLITGGAGGIGGELTKLFARDGYRIIVVDLLKESLDNLGEELKNKFPLVEYRPLQMDLSQQNAAEAVFKWCNDEGLEVDVLVNNVGFGLLGEHVELDLGRIEKMLIVNNMLLTKLSHMFGKNMKLRGHGSILNVASLVAFSPSPFFSAYSATKAFTLAFSVSLARELGEYGVNVSCLCPGTTKTAFLQTAQDGHKSASGITKFVSAFMLTPDIVAKAGYAGLQKNKMIVVPSTFLSIQAFFLRHLPMRFISWFVHQKTK